MKLLRDMDASELIKGVQRIGYRIVRQSVATSGYRLSSRSRMR